MGTEKHGHRANCRVWLILATPPRVPCSRGLITAFYWSVDFVMVRDWLPTTHVTLVEYPHWTYHSKMGPDGTAFRAA